MVVLQGRAWAGTIIIHFGKTNPKYWRYFKVLTIRLFMIAAIALVCEVVFALLRADIVEGFGDCCDEGFDCSGGGLSQQALSLA